jgi:hypothetical protein
MRAARCRPRLCDATLSEQLLCRSGDKEKQRMPVGSVCATLDPEAADEAVVQQTRELDDRLIRPRRSAAIDEELAGEDDQCDIPGAGEPRA